MARQNPANAHEAREALAAKYDAKAQREEQMAANAYQMKANNTGDNLTALSKRHRTWAATARRMAGDQPKVQDLD